MTSKQSISRRITLVLTSLICLAVALAALLTFYIYRQMEERMIDKLVQTESARIALRVSRFGNQWQQPFERDMGPSMYAWGESDTVPAASLPEVVRSLPEGLHYLDQGKSTWHVQVADAMDGKLYVVYDSVVLEQQSRNFALALAGIVLACTLLAWLISGAVARWLVTPLNALTDRLERWVPGPPEPATSSVNEAARLMAVFNRVQDQVDATIANQREFSANLHHEIRTPLTIIRSDAELLMGRPAGEAQPGPDRLRRIVQSVDEIKQSLESTYGLAHASLDQVETVDIRGCVQDIIENLRMEAEEAGLELLNQAQAGHEEPLNRHALMTVLRNIFRNALQHAAPATLEITSLTHGVRFVDTGPGIAPSELPHVFDRYFSRRRKDQRARGADEAGAADSLDQSGLGLAIAQRVCIMQSWALEVASPVREGRGTCFTLRFRDAD